MVFILPQSQLSVKIDVGAIQMRQLLDTQNSLWYILIECGNYSKPSKCVICLTDIHCYLLLKLPYGGRVWWLSVVCHTVKPSKLVLIINTLLADLLCLLQNFICQMLSKRITLPKFSLSTFSLYDPTFIQWNKKDGQRIQWYFVILLSISLVGHWSAYTQKAHPV